MKIVEPKELIFENICDIYKLIKEGGQIKLAPAILLKQIVSCQLIAFEIEGDYKFPVAVAAIKVPQESYVKKVFAHAGFGKGELQHYGYELGYCVTSEGYEGKGFCKKLVTELIRNTSVARLFATTASEAMAHILTKNGFKKVGNTHVTEDNRKIDLYVYEVQ